MHKITPNWPAPSNVHAFTTTRAHQGYSAPPFESFNLALHVGDQPAHVHANREALIHSFGLPSSPVWLNQTHSARCTVVDDCLDRNADASVTATPNTVLAIMTADCVPIILCRRDGTEIAAIHAGWRGLANRIIEETLSKMQSKPSELMAWVGPAICQACYEVGDEVYEGCLTPYPFCEPAFKPHQGKWLADLPEMAGLVLHQAGIQDVYFSKICTFEQKNTLYSYRRAPKTGRIATLIWFNDSKTTEGYAQCHDN